MGTLDLKDFKLGGINDVNAEKTKTFLFVPSDGKDMRTEYPELGSIPEFATLTNTHLVFVWLVGNRTSSLNIADDFDKQNKIHKALKLSKLWDKLSTEDLSNYGFGRFPQNIQSAIQKMMSFNPTARMRAKIISEKMFSNLEKMVDVPEEELSEMSLAEKNAYSNLVKNVTNVIDDLIVSNEEAYGVKIVKKRAANNSDKAMTLMDAVLNMENDSNKS